VNHVLKPLKVAVAVALLEQVANINQASTALRSLHDNGSWQY
jgi:hypothetical protein